MAKINVKWIDGVIDFQITENDSKFSIAQPFQNQITNQKLNTWFSQSNGTSLALAENIHINLSDFGFNAYSGFNNVSYVNFGIFSDENNIKWCLLVPFIEFNSENSFKYNIKLCNLRSIDIQKVDNESYFAAVVFGCKLEENAKWTVLTKLGPSSDENGSGISFNDFINPYFDELYNSSISINSVFTRTQSATPFYCFPREFNFLNETKIRPVFAFDIPDKEKRINLRSIFTHVDHNDDSSVSVNFFGEKSKNSDAIISLIGINPLSEGIQKPSATDEQWKLLIPTNNLPPISIKCAINFIVKCLKNISESSEQNLFIKLKIEQIKINNERAFNFGSMQLAPTKSQNAYLTLILRGTWNSDICDIYPEIDLTGLTCSYQYSSGTDLASLDLYTAFDTASRAEEQLHREGGVVIQGYDSQPQNIGQLRIRAKCESGLNSIIEWEISKAKNGNSEKSKSLYFQAKPFAIARTWEPDLDAEGGEAIAFWSSNDPEGAQWRVADATMTIELPPQAVGEEMERGKRFWPESKPVSSYINPNNPVKYRFSPPTLLEVKPSIKDRRYNPVPNNLQMVFKEAVVTQFVTEIVYPIRTQFKVNDEGLPHIRIAETSSFLGKPAVYLPVYTTESDPKKILSFDKTILADEIAEYKSFKNNDFSNFRSAYTRLRSRHSAVKANYISRLAQYHLYDPYRQDGKLNLKDGLSFRIRSQSEGAPPLISPLPAGVELLEKYLGEISKEPTKFVSDNKFAKGETDGALRAGVIHTIEFASELMAVLKQPTSTTGLIESLSFTALGANGHISVSFDEGRTTFVADVYHGQVGRLQKIRIGRLGVLWNKVRHVIVYERTTVPSQQFQDEQNSPEFNGWPIIRKTAEYIEPIEQIRKFEMESSKDLNSTGFVEACEILSPRIYVNGVWGKDYSHGYEIPLWSRNEKSDFYPKPSLTLRAHAGANQVSRQVLEEPEHLYFYTNTQEGMGSDPDKWDVQVVVDCPIGPARLPVINGAEYRKPKKSEEILKKSAMPEPSLGATRRPRYDLAVSSSGPVNLQHGRGNNEMLAAMNVLSLARTAETKSLSNNLTEKLLEIKSYTDDINQYKNGLEDLLQEYNKKIPEYLRNGITCDEIKVEIKKIIDKYFETLKNDYQTKVVDSLSKFNNSVLANKSYVKDRLNIDLPNPSKQLREILETSQKKLEFLRLISSDEFEKEKVLIKREVENAFQPIQKIIDFQKNKILLIQTQFDHYSNLVTNLVEKIVDLQTIVDLVSITNLEEQLKSVNKSTSDLLSIVKLEKSKLTDLPLLVILLNDAEKFLDKLYNFTNVVVFKDAWFSFHDDLKSSAKEVLNILKNLLNIPVELLANYKTTLNTQNQNVQTLEKSIKEFFLDDADINLQIQIKLKSLFDFFEKELDEKGQYLISQIDTIHQEIESSVDKIILDISNELTTHVKAFLIQITKAEQFLTTAVKRWLEELEETTRDNVNEVFVNCDDLKIQLNSVANHIKQAAKEFSDQIESQAGGYLNSIVDESSQQELAAIAINVSAQAAKGLKLVKAIGDLPALPTLTFNANRAEYVFEDMQNQIETSPFVAKLREVDNAMKELGLAVPAHALCDQIIPSSVINIDFRDVFKNFGGIDFSNLFPKFKLPELSPQNLKITHGLNKETHQAWAKAEVDVDFPEKQELFDAFGIGVSSANMHLNATNDMQIGLNGKSMSTTVGKFTSDMSMDFSGNTMATFRDVTVSFNGGKFDFDISPDKVELHPCINFISVIAKNFIQNNLPPFVELVHDDKGNPVGAKSCITTLVPNLPPLGPISIGALFLQSGLNLMMTKEGFVLSSFLSVGSKATPIFLQIGPLGGGVWLVASATQRGAFTDITASLGMAVGSTRSFDVGGVARGSYSVLLFAYATYEVESGVQKALEFRAGLSMQGSARILGMANASVYLLLEVVHSNNGDTKGHGLLDVSVDICWCYTLHVRQQVEQNI